MFLCFLMPNGHIISAVFILPFPQHLLLLHCIGSAVAMEFPSTFNQQAQPSLTVKALAMDISELYNIFKEHPVVTTDSRDCPNGSIFFALKGASFNGNAFAAKALEQGCSYAVIDEQQYVVANDTRYILTDNCLHTLQQLANYHRRALGTTVIGVTGTNGKTTTKELISAVLTEKYNVLYTQGNFNNDIGVPKTLLRLKSEHQIAVVEMGASHPGDIKTLVDIVEPDYGIITNVGMAHLQGFGSFEGVVRTKGELYDYLRTKHATIFIHNENPYLMGMSNGLALVKYGTNDADDLCADGQLEACAPYLTFKWRHGASQWHHIQTHLIGSYNIYNMLAAACIGLYFKVSMEQIDHALSHYVPTNNRSELETTPDNKLIIDAYNANPTSMNAALTNFKGMAVSHKMVILGDMKELGEVSQAEHQKVVDFLKDADFEHVWLVGSEFKKTDCDFRKFDNVEEVKAAIAENQPKGYYILIKGSNSTKLYLLKDLL